ncbi:MAG: ABC transporter permease [Candidatus Dormibacteraceae bacterium]
MSVAFAFLRRDFLIWGSYRMSVAWQLLGIFAFIGLIYSLGTTIGGGGLAIQGQSSPGQAGSFVAFVLSGIAFTDVLMQGLYSLPQAIRDNQKDGTLEPMLLTPVSTIDLAVSSSLFKFALALFRMAVYLGFGGLVLGLWHQPNLLTLIIVLIPATASFVALGALSAAFIIVLKQGDPVIVAYSAVTALVGGVFFPVSSLPAWIRPVANLVPLTYALDGLRAGLDGAPLSQVTEPVLALCVITAVFLPLGIIAFNWAISRAKMEGSLGQY